MNWTPQQWDAWAVIIQNGGQVYVPLGRLFIYEPEKLTGESWWGHRFYLFRGTRFMVSYGQEKQTAQRSPEEDEGRGK